MKDEDEGDDGGFDPKRDCICADWDGRGRSVCGMECGVHPLDGKCPKCGITTHENRKCIVCSYKDGECE